MEVIVEGKVKTVYQGDDADRVIIEYHDKVTAGNGDDGNGDGYSYGGNGYRKGTIDTRTRRRLL